MGRTLHQESMVRNWAMAALAFRVYNILSNKVTEDNLLCDVSRSELCTEVTSGDIVILVRTTTKTLKIQERIIDPYMIGVHSFRAGGLMALKSWYIRIPLSENLADGRWIHGKCIYTAKLRNYWRALHKIWESISLIKTSILLIHLNNSNGLLETSLINTTGHRRHWRNDPCIN